MRRLELEEYKSYSTNIPLNKDQLRALPSSRAST